MRIKAQYALSRVLEVYLYAGRKLLPHILPMLSNDEKVSHEQFKVSHNLQFLENHLKKFLLPGSLARATNMSHDGGLCS